MKASDLPSLDTIIDPTSVIPQQEIDRINDLYADMRRRAKGILKDAMKIGDWFIDARKRMGPHVSFHSWTSAKFPKINGRTIYAFMKLASNREFLASVRPFHELDMTIHECVKLIREHNKMAKPRIRRLVVNSDADPLVLLEAKLKNYVINLWMLRYLQTEIEGLLESMELTPDQVLRVLHYVCKEHHEVEDEVLRTFKPGLKIVSGSA
jgi:hypothetical protein